MQIYQYLQSVFEKVKLFIIRHKKSQNKCGSVEKTESVNKKTHTKATISRSFDDPSRSIIKYMSEMQPPFQPILEKKYKVRKDESSFINFKDCKNNEDPIVKPYTQQKTELSEDLKLRKSAHRPKRANNSRMSKQELGTTKHIASQLFKAKNRRNYDFKLDSQSKSFFDQEAKLIAESNCNSSSKDSRTFGCKARRKTIAEQ